MKKVNAISHTQTHRFLISKGQKGEIANAKRCGNETHIPQQNQPRERHWGGSVRGGKKERQTGRQTERREREEREMEERERGKERG